MKAVDGLRTQEIETNESDFLGQFPKEWVDELLEGKDIVLTSVCVRSAGMDNGKVDHYNFCFLVGMSEVEYLRTTATLELLLTSDDEVLKAFETEEED